MAGDDRYLTKILERAEGDPLGAAMELGRGLMRGFRPDFKQGYNHIAALESATRIIKLDAAQRRELEAHLFGYSLGLNEDPDQTLPSVPFDDEAVRQRVLERTA